MHVISASQLSVSTRTSDKQLKTLLREHFSSLPRRIDRLAWQALLTAAPLTQHLVSSCGIYLAADYPSGDTMTGLLNSVCIQKLQPRPFEFVNSVSNAAGFYLAKQLDVQGPNLFISAGPQVWQQLLQLAYCDVQAKNCQQALLIVCRGNEQVQLQAVLVQNQHNQLLAADSFAQLSSGLTVTQLVLD
ncbi:hypothetical protein [Thiopseudomonas acetoxidans]|uniref:Beta-ketoacyl synthase N-terminal domain-containing protein n=1 Tax=Thiopseudomonas acetoxidans TaxID=3041622 RepID=A0ABT7SLD6_9GAMM|nr:hypothetical protein [Thiopseudomonas sp. CY1220]MDM7857007.1 hypothetical protein [Thiopseudomonas sp. CY1220]